MLRGARHEKGVPVLRVPTRATLGGSGRQVQGRRATAKQAHPMNVVSGDMTCWQLPLANRMGGAVGDEAPMAKRAGRRGVPRSRLSKSGSTVIDVHFAGWLSQPNQEDPRAAEADGLPRAESRLLGAVLPSCLNAANSSFWNVVRGRSRSASPPAWTRTRCAAAWPADAFRNGNCRPADTIRMGRIGS
jgi:hypothetical protein